MQEYPASFFAPVTRVHVQVTDPNRLSIRGSGRPYWSLREQYGLLRPTSHLTTSPTMPSSEIVNLTPLQNHADPGLTLSGNVAGTRSDSSLKTEWKHVWVDPPRTFHYHFTAALPKTVPSSSPTSFVTVGFSPNKNSKRPVKISCEIQSVRECHYESLANLGITAINCARKTEGLSWKTSQ